jgi:hypothetical protein
MVEDKMRGGVRRDVRRRDRCGLRRGKGVRRLRGEMRRMKTELRNAAISQWEDRTLLACSQI